MSGICGILRLDGGPPEGIEAMAERLERRGPEGTHIFRDGPCALGHTLLATTAEALAECQPFTHTETGCTITADLRLDNRDDLMPALSLAGQGRVIGDAEIVLHAYLKWGEDCAAHLLGDFAFAIWDPRSGRLFCARDIVGAKPFYYQRDGVHLSFASEMKTLLDLPWVETTLDEDILAQYVAFEFYSVEQTLWRGIRRLPQASQLLVKGEEQTVREYWSLDQTPDLTYRRPEEYVEHYSEILFRSVKQATRTHRPLACEVSGGLDSSAVFAVCHELEAKGELLAPSLTGYTLDYRGDRAADEIVFVAAVEQHLGRTVNRVAPASPSLEEVAAFATANCVVPPPPNGLMLDSILCAASESGSVVKLDGMGGDQWLDDSGPSYYAEALQRFDLGTFLRHLSEDRRKLGIVQTLANMPRYGFLPLLPDAVKKDLKKFIFNRSSSLGLDDILSDRLRGRLKEQMAAHLPLEGRHWQRAGQKEKLCTLLSGFAILRFESTEHLSAGRHIDIRSPFYSRAGIEFSFATRPSLRQREGTNRWVHREAMRQLLPERVRLRRSKAEFSVAHKPYIKPLSVDSKWQEVVRRRDWVSEQGMVSLQKALMDRDLRFQHICRMWALLSFAHMSGLR